MIKETKTKKFKNIIIVILMIPVLLSIILGGLFVFSYINMQIINAPIKQKKRSATTDRTRAELCWSLGVR